MMPSAILRCEVISLRRGERTDWNPAHRIAVSVVLRTPTQAEDSLNSTIWHASPCGNVRSEIREFASTVSTAVFPANESGCRTPVTNYGP
jgi:hypothetical protein